VEELDVEAFRSWLESRTGEEVGEVVNITACPLAKWLSEIHECSWYVSPSYYGDNEGHELYQLPAWASSFVAGLDSRYGPPWCVTGTQALVVLDEIVPR
jgi:hypothetical protein